jgi:hypothetical protein
VARGELRRIGQQPDRRVLCSDRGEATPRIRSQSVGVANDEGRDARRAQPEVRAREQRRGIARRAWQVKALAHRAQDITRDALPAPAGGRRDDEHVVVVASPRV